MKLNTSHYEAEHGKAPHHNQKGTWTIRTPRTFGRRLWVFEDMSWNEAKAMATEVIAGRPVGENEEFVLEP